MKLYELQTPDEIRELEAQLDALMRPVGLDVEFSRHFIERLLGREQRVTIDEVKMSFAKLKGKYKNRLKKAKKTGGYKAVLQDLSNELNIVFAVTGGELTNITIMRKEPGTFRSDNYDVDELRV